MSIIGFREVNKSNCATCIYCALNPIDVSFLVLSSYTCKKHDFQIAYPATCHVCDYWKEEFDYTERLEE
jgi:hypothetical protein